MPVEVSGRQQERSGRGRQARRTRPMRGSAVLAVAALGLLALPSVSPASAGVTARAAGRSAGAAVPAVPATAQFVAAPRVTPAGSDLRQACATPTRPGQMACMALLPPNTRRAGPDADAPSGYGPPDLQAAYGLTTDA